MTEKFENKAEAIDLYIRPALGEFADDYDLDGIFGEVFTWGGNGFVIADGADDDFFSIAQRYDQTKN